MPRRPRAAAVPPIPAAPRITNATAGAAAATSPAASSGHTLVHALENMPVVTVLPKTVDFDGDLTPPPQEVKEKTGELVERAVEKVVGRAEKRKRSKPVSYAEQPGEDGEDEEDVQTKPKPGRSRRKAAVTEDGTFTEESESVSTTTPKKGKGRKNASAAMDDEDSPKEKKAKKPTPKKSRLAKDEPEYDSEGNEIVKKKRKPKVYPKIEYDIPPVERKETTFRGLIFFSKWSLTESSRIRFMRMSSEMFPFASHAKYGYDLSFAATELKEAGDLAKKYGHRLTMHPGQFTQLGSPKEAVVEASIRELNYQCEIMDRMGLDQDGVMIIHMGGIYGDKPSTLERFKANFQRLDDNVRARLVLENDEICYNVDDLLPHHDWINPSCEPPSVLIPKIAEMWKKRGIRMKQHLSEPRPGAESVMERRAHADRCKALPKDLPDDVDLMIEAKDKEQAVFELYRIYGLEDVFHDNLRPPDPNPSMQTKGRKSSVKKKTKETGMVDEDGNPVELDDVEKEGDGEIGDEAIKENRVEEPSEEVKAEASEKIKVESVAARGGKRGRQSEVADEAQVNGVEPDGPKRRGSPKKVVA
ncbi:UV-damage endonuclease [Saitozyma sp. JCM 24511]|nr:UV-damage endonuclease [Saitozyma sp. JCM 24511]